MQTQLLTPQANITPQKNLVRITQNSGIPLIGSIAFGIVLRSSTSLIQVRPTTICNMNCTFCSTDAGPFSKYHKTNFIVDPDYLFSWIKEVVSYKGQTHANIDSVGEPTTYPHLEKLIQKISTLQNIYFISMQTNGTYLTEQKIRALEQAGLKRIHLSIHSFAQQKSQDLFGSKFYSIEKVKEAVNKILSSNIELAITPVWIPKINDEDITQLIQFAKDNKIKIAIQKYEEYRFSRKIKSAKKTNFFKFYKQLKEWQKTFNTKLIFSPEDFNIHRSKQFPLDFRINEKVNAIARCPGWYPNQLIAASKNRAITVINPNQSTSINDAVNIKLIENKNNIYLAESV